MKLLFFIWKFNIVINYRYLFAEYEEIVEIFENRFVVN